MRHPSRVLLVALLITVFGAEAAHAQRKRQPSPYVGKEFPNFTAKNTHTGEKFELEDYRGKVVLIDFWATWCGPCVRELPNVRAARAKYEDRGFEVISISLDSSDDKFRQFVKRERMDWPQVMEGGGWKTRLAKKYRIRSIPAMFIIDHDGMCRTDRARGTALEREIDRALAKLDAAGGPPETRDTASRTNRPAPRESAVEVELRHRIAEARETLKSATGDDKGIRMRLGLVDQILRMLENELPTPKDADATRKRYERMIGAMSALRQDLFICGCLNDRVIAIPENVFADPDRSLHSCMVAAREQIQPARKALGDLRLAASSESGHARRLRSALDEVAAELRRSDADLVALSVRVDEVTKEVVDFEERCRDPWTAQLLIADTVVANLAGGGGGLEAQADELAKQIAELRKRLEGAERRTDELIALRDEFHVVCKDLARIVEDLERAGVTEAGSIDLPHNPLLSGRLRDVRTQIETREQIGRASRALSSLREMMGDADEKMAGYDREIRSMQAEYARLRQSSTSDLTDLERRFRALCAEILDVLDA